MPPSQASLALGVIGLGQAWHYISVEIIRPYLLPVRCYYYLPRYLTSFNTFINDIRHPLSGLMAPMSMALLILCDYLAEISPIIACIIIACALLLHFTVIRAFYFQIIHFKTPNIVPSCLLYPAGRDRSSQRGSVSVASVFSETLAATYWHLFLYASCSAIPLGF